MENNDVNISDEMDLIELFQYIWSKRKFIIKVTLIFFLLGVFISVVSKKEYEATCKLMPEIEKQDSKLGGLGGLASLAGVDLSSSSGNASGFPPTLYPELVKGTSFIQKLIKTPIFFEEKDTMISSYVYFDKVDKPSLFSSIIDYTIGLPGKLFSKKSNNLRIKNYEMIRFSEEDWELISNYKDRIEIDVDKKTSVIEIGVQMPDPVAAASITKLVVNQLTNKATEYKINKETKNLDFIQNRFKESKTDYEIKQRRLAIYSDRNRNVTTSLVRTEYQRLQNEMNIAYEVYKNLASQLEQAKIKVKQETPIFTVLEEVRIPEKKIKPKRGLIIIIFSFLGFFLGVTFILIKKFIPHDKQ